MGAFSACQINYVWIVYWNKSPFCDLTSRSRARQLADGTLWIDNVQAEDDGLYVCMAENIAGSVRAVGRLSVHSELVYWTA